MFGTKEITPLRQLDENLYVLGLSNGPTLAFKDVALQLLGNLFEYELASRDEELNVLGATSGDTGSAAEYALLGKKGIRIFMLSPKGRMSTFQKAQMYSLREESIFNIVINGTFDDCQDLVKTVCEDNEFKRQFKIGAVNSINWARIVAQMVYYFSAYLQLPGRFSLGKADAKASFAVPSGNFGNACAGHIARITGLPIEELVIATNENDVLDEFFQTGTYRPRSKEETLATSSPSMDINKASNLERPIFDVCEWNGDVVRNLFEQIKHTGSFTLCDFHKRRLGAFPIVSGSSTHEDRLRTIAEIYREYNVIIDPHTADAMCVALKRRRSGTPMIVLETASPIKFPETIRDAIGLEPMRPEKFRGIEDLPQRTFEIDGDVATLKAFIRERCTS